jgi:hypothetical protein
VAIGPVQLLVLGFNHPDFRGEIIEELERLRANAAVRVIDSLAVFKDADGAIEIQHLGTLSGKEEQELGEHAMAGGAGVGVFAETNGWDVLDDIPNNAAAALVLIEHHWAVSLRDAIARAGGFRISDGFISPLDLVEIGLVSAEEPSTLHAIETGAAPRCPVSRPRPEGAGRLRATCYALRVRAP